MHLSLVFDQIYRYRMMGFNGTVYIASRNYVFSLESLHTYIILVVLELSVLRTDTRDLSNLREKLYIVSLLQYRLIF